MKNKKIIPSHQQITFEHRVDLAITRNTAMQLIGGLKRLAADKGKPADEKLLGKHGGVIEAFSTVAQLLTKVVDKERQGLVLDQKAGARPMITISEWDEGIEKRIADELNRIAARKQAIGSAPADCGEPGESGESAI
jgi:hypothetical protein